MSCTAYILMNGVLTPNEDLSIGSQVTLTNQDDTDVTTWDWKIVSKPTGSTAALSGSSSATAYFTPDVEGAYLIRLIVNEGLVTEEQGTSVGRVKTLHKSLLPHAKDETSEGHPVEGWAKAWRESYLKVDKAIGIPSDRRTVKYSGSATTGPVFLTADGTMYTMANGDVIPSVRLATAADDKQAMFLFESGALAPGVVTVLEHGMSESITLAGASAGDKLYATANGAITKTSQAYLHRPIAYCIYASGGAARVWFNPVDYTLLSTLDHEQLQGLLGGAANAHYHLNQNQYNAVNGASSPSGTNVFVTTSVLGGYVPTTRRVDTSTGLTGGGALSSDLTLVNDGVLTVNNLKGALTIAGETGGIDISQSGATITIKNLGVKSVAGTSGRITPTVASTGAVTLDLATIPGLTATTYGSATNIPVMTVDAYGRITAISNQSVTFNSGTVTSITLDTGSTGLKVNTNQTSQQITTSGTFTLSGTLAVGSGGTGLSAQPGSNQILVGTGSGYALKTLSNGLNTVVKVLGNDIYIDASFNPPVSAVTGTTGQIVATTPSPGVVQLALADTAVIPTNYGSTTQVPQIAVDQKGRLTGVTNQPISFPVTSVGTNGTLTVSPGTGAVKVDLSTLNPSPYGTYGAVDGTIYPIITVDNYGRVTSVTTKSIEFPSYTQTQYGAMRNYVINGAFDFWQRLPNGGGVVLSSTNIVYVADRWCWFTSVDTNNMEFNALHGSGGAGINDHFGQYLSYNRQPTQMVSGPRVLAQGIESEFIPTIMNRRLRLLFKYKFTAVTPNTMQFVNVYVKYTTDQNHKNKSPKSYYNTGTTVLTSQIDTSKLPSDTWIPFDRLTSVLPEDVSAIGVMIEFNPTSNVAGNTAEGFNIANVMLLDAGASGQYGTVDMPYLYSSGTIANELVACQRYYEKSFGINNAVGTYTSTGAEVCFVPKHTITTAAPYLLGSHPRFKVTKRAVPSKIEIYGTTSIISTWTLDTTVNTSSVYYPSDVGFQVGGIVNLGSTGLAFGHWTADAEYY